MNSRNCCSFSRCEAFGTFRCSRCHSALYCGAEHQRLDWKDHKIVCKLNGKIVPASSGEFDDGTEQTKIIISNKPIKSVSSSIEGNEAKQTIPNVSKQATEPNAAASEKRECRCMFCGENLLLSSEDEAVDHMGVCPALQEQLQSKDPITVPSMVKRRMHMK